MAVVPPPLVVMLSRALVAPTAPPNVVVPSVVMIRPPGPSTVLAKVIGAVTVEFSVLTPALTVTASL